MGEIDLDITEFERLISKYGEGPENPPSKFDFPVLELFFKDEQGNEYPLIMNNEMPKGEMLPIPKLFGPYYREVKSGS